MSLRIGGYAAILGGVLWLVAARGQRHQRRRGVGWPWLGPALVGAVVATLVALIGLSAFQARRYPALTWAAFAVPAAGAVVALLATVAIAINGSTDREIIGGFTGWAVASLGFLALVVGSGLFALATLRARSLPRAASALLLAGAVATVPALGGLSGGLVPEAMVPVLIGRRCCSSRLAGWLSGSAPCEWTAQAPRSRERSRSPDHPRSPGRTSSPGRWRSAGSPGSSAASSSRDSAVACSCGSRRVIDRSALGLATSNGNRIGDVTVGGTVAFVLFVGLLFGAAVGVLWVTVAPWMARGTARVMAAAVSAPR